LGDGDDGDASCDGASYDDDDVLSLERVSSFSSSKIMALHLMPDPRLRSNLHRNKGFWLLHF